jgi:hypothetical protein
MPPNFSPALAGLIKKILVRNPSSRITMDKLKNHAWCSSYLPQLYQPGLIPGVSNIVVDRDVLKVAGKKMKVQTRTI